MVFNGEHQDRLEETHNGSVRVLEEKVSTQRGTENLNCENKKKDREKTKKELYRKPKQPIQSSTTD